jgi:hypothetical protein
VRPVSIAPSWPAGQRPVDQVSVDRLPGVTVYEPVRHAWPRRLGHGGNAEGISPGVIVVTLRLDGAEGEDRIV